MLGTDTEPAPSAPKMIAEEYENPLSRRNDYIHKNNTHKDTKNKPQQHK